MNDRIIFGQMVDQYRKELGLSMEELGNILNKDKSSISRWIKGERFPKIEEAEEIARYFNVPFEVLIFGEQPIEKDDINYIYDKLNQQRQQKVYNFAENQLKEQNKVISIEEAQTVYLNSKLSAGTGILDLDPTDTKEVEYNGYLPKHDLAFEVSGNSMEPAFADGEIVFVEKTPDVHNGQFIAVQINEEAYIKKAYIEDERLRLVSLNRDYKDIYACGDDDIRIIGRVIL